MSKKYLLILLVSLVLFVPRETFAAVTWNWSNGNKILQTDIFYDGVDCQNSSCTNNSGVEVLDVRTIIGTGAISGFQDYESVWTVYKIPSITFTNSNQWDMLVFKTNDMLINNYRYSGNVYFCSDKNMSGIRINNIYTGSTRTQIYNKTYLTTGFNVNNTYAIGNNPWNWNSNISEAQPSVAGEWNYCYSIPFNFTANTNSQYFGLSFNNGGNNLAISRMYIIGYTLDNIGWNGVASQATLNQVNTNVNNIQSSLNGVQSSVNSVQNSLNGVQSSVQDVESAVNQTNDTITNDTVTESNNYLRNNIVNNSAFNQDHGITAIVQAPINFLQSLNNKTCSSITLPIPHLGDATIPCMSTIYSTKFSNLYNILKVIINGVICYRLALSVVMIIRGAKDPNEDKIEVMDL